MGYNGETSLNNLYKDVQPNKQQRGSAVFTSSNMFRLKCYISDWLVDHVEKEGVLCGKFYVIENSFALTLDHSWFKILG